MSLRLRTILCVFFLAFLTLCTETTFAVKELPEYDCVWIAEELKIDGILDEPAWHKVQDVELLLTDTEEKPDNPTEAKLFWNDDYLYISFACIDPEIWATINKRDGDLYKEEVVEVFIDADSDMRTYLELEVNPLNALFDASVINKKDQNQGTSVNRDWNSKDIKHEVKIDGEVNSDKEIDKSWACEIAVPLNDFSTAPNIPPKPGDVWRINLYRIDHGKDKSEYSAWSTTGKIDFHIPQRFGYLKFVKETTPMPAVSPSGNLATNWGEIKRF